MSIDFPLFREVLREAKRSLEEQHRPLLFVYLPEANRFLGESFSPHREDVLDIVAGLEIEN